MQTVDRWEAQRVNDGWELILPGGSEDPLTEGHKRELIEFSLRVEFFFLFHE